ncbi:MAG: redoxin domain-containing protein [Planctomycetia bacterium]|nr:redoxin domain-containing protein [Planctomycetia bacterium]
MSATKTICDRPTAASSPSAGNASARRLFWTGVILSIALVLIFFAQVFWAGVMITPWYLPIGGTVCAVAVLAAVRGQARWWRLGIAVLCVALAGLEWFFLLAVTVLPAYTGPMAEGTAIPAFRAALADGTEIDESFFRQGRPTALVFFQGRWCPFCMTHLRELEAHHEEFARVRANVVVVSIEDVDTAAATQRDFPHLTVVSDERRELADAVDVINKQSAPDGGDSAAPTILLVDSGGTVRWLHRPTRFIERPTASRLASAIERQLNH